MANRRADKEKAEKSKDILLNIVEGYCRETDEEKKEGLNKGTLKFLKNTRVRAVVLSANPKRKRTVHTFRRYLEKMILPKEYDRLISYMDPERNLDAFLACSHFFEEEELKSAFMDDGPARLGDMESGRTGGILLPFFLLEDLQKTVEMRLDAYMKQKGTDFYVSGDGNVKDEYAANAKEEKYLDFVYSLQYYEIFMETFRERIMEPSLPSQEEEAFRAIQELNGQFAACAEKNKKIELGKKILERMREWMVIFNKKRMSALYCVLYMRHYMNLMAMLRLLIIVEYVNIKHSYTGVRDEEEKAKQRKNMEQLVTKELLGFDLFFFHYRDNPNLAVIFRDLTITAEKRSLIPDPGNQEEMQEFYNNLKAYVTQIRKKKAGERNAAEESLLMKSQILLAKPLLCKLVE
ncbi:MAG: hypothetical protein HFI39_09765 [Lachnospiraceae bacterium]|nr:hypothetical protein [Lachnospiraceae bacterium]